MHIRTCLALLLTLAMNTALAAPGIGDPAPGWTLPGSDGQSHTLTDHRGRFVVVAFFPRAFTGG